MSRRSEVLEAPAAALAQRLRDLGFVDEATLLGRWIPTEVSDDTHLPLLRSDLRAVSSNTRLPTEDRDAAARLATLSIVEAIGPIGTVYIAWWEPRREEDTVAHPAGYQSYWDEQPDGVGFLEEGPSSTDLHEMLHWARQRSARIVVRPQWASDTSYWAGDDRLRPPSLPRLPAAPGGQA